MKIWILGKNGLLGKALVKECQNRHLDFVATSQDQVDITELKQLTEFGEKQEITHIINCAAYTAVDLAEKEQDIAYRINAEGPENLGIVGRKLATRVLHISTDYVFDGENDQPYNENDICEPLNVYGMSKWVGENRLLNQLSTSCVVRTSWLFGKGGKNFISTILSKKNEQIRAVSDQKSRLTYVDDLVEALLKLLCHSGVYHFANSGEVSRFEIASAICENVTAVSSREFILPAKRPNYSVLATNKIESVLGKAPRTWKEAICHMLNES